MSRAEPAAEPARRTVTTDNGDIEATGTMFHAIRR
jgi:hypothetical protein